MKKKIILILLTFFSFSNVVNAGICDTDVIDNSVSGYCKKQYELKYTDIGRSGNNIGHFYSVNNPYSATKDYGFCIDPGLASPDTGGTWQWIRPLNLSNIYDQHYYKIYQYYVLNHANNFEFREKIGVLLRLFTIKDGISIRTTNGLNEDYHNNIFKYMDGAGSKKTDKYGYALGNFENYKQTYKDISNQANYVWENPLKITPTITFDSTTNIYKFNFEVKFVSANYKYFNVNDGINVESGDRDIDGHGYAYFKIEDSNIFQINNGAYAVDNKNVVEYSGGGFINRDTENANETKNFYLKMSKEVYDAIKETQGYVDVSFNYETYHPMSVDNIYLNYDNGRVTNTNASYQRMIVFSKYINKGTIHSGEIEIQEEVELCSQDANNFYYNGNLIGIEEYKSKCGCARIDENVITNTTKKELYDNLCLNTFEPIATSTLNSCFTESVVGKNTVTYTTKQTINAYCNVECTETIEIDDYIDDSLTVKAGKYFSLDKYPKLNANKTCKIPVDYDSWFNDYKTLLTDQINALNKVNYNNAELVDTDEVMCSDDGFVYYANIYKYEYTKYYLNNTSIHSYKDGYTTGGCNGRTKNEYPNADLEFTTSITNLENHFSKLSTCSKYLSNNTNEEFYNFNAELKFYYQQEYESLGLKYNYEKPNGENDDSLFRVVDPNTKETKTPIATETDNTYEDYKNDEKSYTYFSNENIQATLYVGTDNWRYNTDISRAVEYEYYFYPSVYKYADIHTGIVSSSYSKFININLGYYYDTDVSAKAKTNNDNRYIFTALGDDNAISQYYYNKYGNLDELTRTCTYETTTEYILEPIFRSVNPKNLDPNNRLGVKGFLNWDNTKGLVVKETIENDDTFNPENLEYEFTLDNLTLKQIRDDLENEEEDYLDFNLQCNSVTDGSVEGNECISDFVTKYADLKDGRNKWKYLSKDVSGNWEIKEYETGEMTQALFNSLYQDLGGEVTP